MKKIFAIFVAKQTGFWSRIFGRGGGAALPGLLAMKIYPEIVKELTKNLEKGVILVTGTNGKTTTSKMIVEILEASGLKVLSNSGGSNLTRGIASELASKSNIFGKIKEEIGVYEVDEATMPEIINNLQFTIQNGLDSLPRRQAGRRSLSSEVWIPASAGMINEDGNDSRQRDSSAQHSVESVGTTHAPFQGAGQAKEGGNDNLTKAIVITNIFRDQLDRYGEVDKTAAIIEEAIKNAPGAKLILNADDPMVASLGLPSVISSETEETLEKNKKRDSSARRFAKSVGMTNSQRQKIVLYFGIEDPRISAGSELAIDSKDCLVCGNELNYSKRYYGHVGIYECPKCGFTRPNPKISAKDIKLNAENISTKITIKRESFELKLPMVGLYNIYNALAATAVASFLDIKSITIAKTLSHLKPAFGRMESFEKDGKKAVIHLVKNPTGFNQVVEAISSTRKPKTALLILNDNFADGTDISWIWDSEYEIFKNYFSNIIVSGIRSEDLRLRLKYADVSSRIITVKKDIGEALEAAIKKTGPDEKLYILPTYTAMLELRNILVKEKILDNYWT